MIKNMKSSSLHISISGRESELGQKPKQMIEKTFKCLFGESAKKVSDERDSAERVVELVYEIKMPVINDEALIKEFFENMEILLDELSEYNPHFTQFRSVDK